MSIIKREANFIGLVKKIFIIPQSHHESTHFWDLTYDPSKKLRCHVNYVSNDLST